MSFCFISSAPVTVQSYSVCSERMLDCPLACASRRVIATPTNMITSAVLSDAQKVQHVRRTTSRL